MHHVWLTGDRGAPVLVLLHGTGGTARDLIPLAQRIHPNPSILSFLGDVNEAGMARFFTRLKPGVFDEVDVIRRAKTMRVRLENQASQRGFSLQEVIAIGYSNGANLLAAMLFLDEAPFKRAVLLHPMVPLAAVSPAGLAEKTILVTAGKNDPICPQDESQTLADAFKNAGADVTIRWFNEGHSIGNAEVHGVESWVQNTIKKG